jgi:diguanylate cyclase (GGDEF)-like protein/PAS domain S-box-containing protein
MFRLKQRFLIFGSFIFAVFTAVVSYGIYLHNETGITSYGESENLFLADFLSDLLREPIEHYTASLAANQPVSADNDDVREIERIIHEFSAHHPVLKVKLFSLRGETLYSTIASDIGKTQDDITTIVIAGFKGQPVSSMAFKPSFQSLAGELSERYIVETYLPFRSAGGRVSAVFELYSDVTYLVDQAHQRLLRLLAFTVAGFLVQFFVLYFFIVRADRTIVSQYNQLEEHKNLVEQARTTLEETVARRTEDLAHTLTEMEAEVEQRRKAETELSKLSIAVEQSPTSVMITDPSGTIEYVNPQFTNITGWLSDEVVGQSPRILRSGETPSTRYAEMWQTIASGNVWQGEFYNRRKNGENYLQSITISPIRDNQGQLINFLALSEDITLRKEYEERIHHLAHHDALTGLANRFSLMHRLEQATAQSVRDHKSLAVFFLDLDRFKKINDSLGHKAGDDLLIQVGQRLKGIFRRKNDVIARIGGDEFVVAMCGISHPTAAALTARAIVEVLSLPYAYEGQELITSPSVGISLYPDDCDSVDALLKCADTAMYHAKEAGRGNYQFFTSDMNRIVEERLVLEQALREAINNDGLALHYQPKICVAQQRVCGVEALLRWQHAELGWIGPDRFIPIAEDSGLIVDLGYWVIRTAFAQIDNWQRKGLGRVHMAINVSARQLEDARFVARVGELIEEMAIDPGLVEFEITESAAMADPKEAIVRLEQLRALGVGLAIDDFGTGYSSLAYLSRLPVQSLKLDRAFVTNVDQDEHNGAICKATISLAHSLGMTIVAEGVENDAERRFLMQNDCDLIQGFFYSRPDAAKPIEAFISNFNAAETNKES